MADEHKGIALVILGIVAVIAVVGLILLFVQGKAATGQGIYGGAIKQIEYPNWVGRGVPRNIPGDIPGPGWVPGTTTSSDMHTSWNYYGDPKRNPYGDVPSAITACGRGGFMIGAQDGLPDYYANLGYQIVSVAGVKGGYVCVYPQTELVGGIAR